MHNDTQNVRKKQTVAIDIQSDGRGGGPYTSTTRIIKSNLKLKYNFKTIRYNVLLGRGISISRIKDLINQLKMIKPDIVHFTGLQLSGFHIVVACRLAGIKNTVITVRGFTGDMIYFSFIKKLILTYILEPLTLLFTKRIYVNSEYVSSRKLLRIFKSKCLGAIYNFPPSPYVNLNLISIRKELGISGGDIVVVTVARINKEKGYHILDEAILKLNHKRNLKFIIVGNGTYLNDMRTKLAGQVKSKQVFFLGYRHDIQRILNDCDIFVLPTLHETLGVALLEASVEGLALIASKTGGVPEIVEDGYNGFLVPPGDINALQQAISILYSKTSLRKKFCDNARLKIHDKISSKSIEEKIDKVYQSLLFD